MGELDAPAADPDKRADLQKPQPYGAAGGGGVGVREADPAQAAEQDIGHGGEP
jgi:hypothetical protein